MGCIVEIYELTIRNGMYSVERDSWTCEKWDIQCRLLPFCMNNKTQFRQMIDTQSNGFKHTSNKKTYLTYLSWPNVLPAGLIFEHNV